MERLINRIAAPNRVTRPRTGYTVLLPILMVFISVQNKTFTYDGSSCDLKVVLTLANLVVCFGLVIYEV